VQAVPSYTRIGPDKIRNAQLPANVMTAGDVILQRPAHWS
jgi:hypothetical protein